MGCRRGNTLIVIENGKIQNYSLDDRLVWEVGRPSKDNIPNIKMHSPTVSRKHGVFKNVGGMWFYIDNNGKNGTVYNGKHISVGISGRLKPTSLSNGDVLIFGGGEEAVINSKTIWTMFSEKVFDENWRIENTKDFIEMSVTDGKNSTTLKGAVRGTVVEFGEGIFIYMGTISYLIGNIAVTGV